MGAEIGATCSLFPYDDAHRRAYLKATGREALADLADALRRAPAQRPRGRRRPRAVLRPRRSRSTSSTLEPHLVGPHTPDLDRPISEVGADGRERGLPGRDLGYALVGSCTNSSYEDIGRAAHVARQAAAAGPEGEDAAPRSRRAPSRCAPRSSATACSPTSRRSARPCSPTRAARASASGSATTSQKGERTRSSSSFNRNFPARNDGNAATLVVHRLARDGRRDGAHRPARRRLRPRADHRARRHRGACSSAPVGRRAAGARASTPASRASSPPADDPSTVDDRGGARLASGSSCSSRSRRGTATTSRGLRVLLKAVGKCTTDHISPAGPWLQVPRPPHQHLAATCSSARTTRSRSTTPGSGVDVRDGSVDAAARSRQRVQGRRHRVGRGRRRELRRGLVARARGDGAAVHERAAR